MNRVPLFFVVLVTILVALGCQNSNSETGVPGPRVQPGPTGQPAPALGQRTPLASYSLKALRQGAPNFIEVGKRYQFNVQGIGAAFDQRTGQLEHITFTVLEIGDSGWIKVGAGAGGRIQDLLIKDHGQGWLNLAHVIEIVGPVQ